MVKTAHVPFSPSILAFRIADIIILPVQMEELNSLNHFLAQGDFATTTEKFHATQPDPNAAMRDLTKTRLKVRGVGRALSGGTP